MRLQKKLPDLKKALDTVILLLSKQARGGGAPTPARAAPEALPHHPVQASSEATGVEFQLTDNIFAKVSSRLRERICRGPERAPPAPQAVLQDTRTVCLWLGANVMLEYSLEEARAPSTRAPSPSACLRLAVSADALRAARRNAGGAAADAQPRKRAEQPGGGQGRGVVSARQHHNPRGAQRAALMLRRPAAAEARCGAQVCIARIYNWDVSRRRSAGAQAAQP